MTGVPKLFTYEDKEIGSEAIDNGNLALASLVFSEIVAGMGDATPTDIYHLWGITQRLIANRDDDAVYYGLAEEKFDTAFQRAKSELDQARILRDWAMVYVGQYNYDEAEALLIQSSDLLRPTRELRLSWIGRLACRLLHRTKRLARDKASYTERSLIHEEYYVTQGFLARVYALRGGSKNRHTARRLFRCANRELYGIAPYELNNRVWDLKVEPLWYRLLVAPRTLKLARQSRNRKRVIQVILLIVYRPLALYLEERRRG